MNDGFPPLSLPEPDRRPRRSEKPRLAPLPTELLAKRAEIARLIGTSVAKLSRQLRKLSGDERRAVFYKLEHGAPIDLVGTGLKPIARPTPEITLAVPKDDSLDKLASKLSAMGTGAIKKGHVPNESLAFLTKIQAGDPKDRLSDDLFDNYEKLIKEKWLLCEIEFYSLLQGPKKQKAEIEQWLQSLSDAFAAGVHGSLFEHELALPTCRAVIRCSGKFFRTLVESDDWVSRIRWFESRPKFQTYQETLRDFRIQDLGKISAPSASAPLVCVIDSGLSSGNPFLKPVTKDDLLRSYLKQQPDNPSDEHGHGSAVSSLAAYYALSLAKGATNQAKVWVASARILNQHNALEDERLFSRLLEDVVKDFVPLGVRVFCLAVGDAEKRWNTSTKAMLPRKSWVARKIDQLSREHDVVFVTCTGNIDLAEIQDFTTQARNYPTYFRSEDARLLDPGQAALALTVGSIAPGTKTLSKPALPLADRYQPSPFTRCGPGIRKDVKPELVEYGGNLAFDSRLSRVISNDGLNVVTASSKLTPPISHSLGTSLAAPRVAHKLALVLEDLVKLGITKPSAGLLKAFLVNSAQYLGADNELKRTRDEFAADGDDRFFSLVGYGFPDHVQATGCDDYSAIVYFDGTINPNEVAFFDVPVPAELVESKNKKKRLTVTVAHAPEVQRWGLERYLAVDLKWRMFRGNVDRDSVVAAMSEAVSESDEELPDDEEQAGADAELPSELAFRLKVNRRSRGTVQHDWHEWTQHKTEYSDGQYTLAIAAYKRWNRAVQPVPVAVVIRIEDLGRAVPVYARVQAVLTKIKVPVRAATR
jgi:subtilase family protein